MVQGLSLPQRSAQLKEVCHVYTVGFGKEEAFVDVLVQDFVVVGPSVKLREVAVQVERVFASGNEHGKLGESGDHLSRGLADTCCLDDFLIEDLCG